LVFPTKVVSDPLPSEVDEPYATDFYEAREVLGISAKASAALSRRLLQNIIREQAGVKARNLNQEIQLAIDGGQVPGHLAEAVDAIRQVGNFSAHPVKYEHTGEIWMLSRTKRSGCLRPTNNC